MTVSMGAHSDSPNHRTDRNAQHIAEKVRRTMIQLSMKDSKFFLIPIKRPIAVPINMHRTKPLKILTRVFHIIIEALFFGMKAIKNYNEYGKCNSRISIRKTVITFSKY